jgi:hypothetical protein
MPRYSSAIQIPNLPTAIALNGQEQLEAVQAGTSVRLTTQQIASYAANANVIGLLPFTNVTTAEKNALVASAGVVVFDTDLSKLCVYNGAAWETITSV